MPTRSGPTVLIFLTDGLPTAGETNSDRIIANVGPRGQDVRLFAFGVGYDVNTVLLDQLSADHARPAYVAPEQNIDETVSEFYARSVRPVLVDVGLSWPASRSKTSTLTPCPTCSRAPVGGDGPLPHAGPVDLTLSGTVDGKARPTPTADLLRQRGGNEFIPRLWATAQDRLPADADPAARRQG